MNSRLSVILAILRKDLIGLLPLVLMALATFLIVPVVANLDLVAIGGDQAFWLFLQANIYWLGFALGIMLMISVIQQDPADSLNHDWLTRPISRRDWLLAKLLFMLLVFLIPVLISRIIINLSQGMGPGLALSYAAGIESMESTMLVPLLLMMALLAPTLRKLIMLLVGVFFVFLLPGWSATRPILSVIGIDFGGDYDSLMWVQGVVLTLASSVGALCIYWFLYCRRQIRLAYLAFWSAVAVMFLAVYSPTWLYSWDQAIAINAALINEDNAELEDQIILDQAMACFPAAIAGNPNATEQENRVLDQAAWILEAESALEPGAMTFATSVRDRQVLSDWYSPTDDSRHYSVKWRLDWILARARYAADSLAEDVPLRASGTALNRYNPLSPTRTDYWAVPAATLEQLRDDPSTRLIMDFDAVMLSPAVHELPMDGQWHKFPALGSCRAERNTARNQVDIECLKRGAQPNMLSAQFIGMESSRVDSRFRGIYTHDWVESIKRQRYELTLPMPSLVDSDRIMMTAWQAERFLHKEMVMPGLLGNNQSICPLPGESASDIERASSWSDKSPHEVSYISVEPGVRLEVLDWREEVKPDAVTLVLLPGLGATAHSYDVVAEKLARDYNVIAMTRRGTGASSKPDRGYNIERLSQDVLTVMDALSVDSAVLVGHSFGGEELSYLGANHPERFIGLVYADAAYDRVSVSDGDLQRRHRELSVGLPPEPPIRPSEAVSYVTLQSYSQRTGRNANIPEGEIIASYDLSTGNIKHDSLYLDALMRGIVAPDYENISVPALGLYALPGSPEAMIEGWYDHNDPQIQATAAELYDMEVARKWPQIQQFETRIPDARAVVLEDADHWIFVSDEDAVLNAIRNFIDEIAAGTVAN